MSAFLEHPWSGACGPLNVSKSPLWAPAGAHFCWCLGRSGGSFSWLGQRCSCLLLHGRERLDLHDLLSLGDQIFVVIRRGRGKGVSARAGLLNVSGWASSRPESDLTGEVGAAEGGSADPLGQGHDNPPDRAHG